MSATDGAENVAEFLGAHPFFARLNPQLRRWLANRFTVVRVLAGEWLLHQGEVAEALYLVTSGRLQWWYERGETAVAGATVGPGATVGEASVLTAEPLVGSVRALRDTESIMIDRNLLLSLVQESRQFSAALLTFLGEALAATGELAPAPHAQRAVIAVVSLGGDIAADAFRSKFVALLSGWGTTALVEDSAASDEAGWARRLDELERGHDFVVLDAGRWEADDRWSNFCLRQADRVVALTASEWPTPALGAVDALRGCELVFTDTTTRRAARSHWRRVLQPRAHYRLGRDVAPVARRVTGRSVGVVLSGGGARGLAHIGVLRGLLDAGIPIDRIGGTSMGAFVGSMFAHGHSPEEITQLFRQELVERKPFNDYGVPVVSLARGIRARAMMQRLFGETAIEDLALDFFCVTADLVTGEAVVHRTGDVLSAVGASMSIPGWAPPLRIGDRVLVDGGVLNNFPVDVMAETDEGPIIGVDAMGMGRDTPGVPGMGASRPGRAPTLPNMMETLAGAVTLGSRRRAEINAGRAAVVIRPDLGATGLLAFDQLDRLFAAGRRAAADAIADAPLIAGAAR